MAGRCGPGGRPGLLVVTLLGAGLALPFPSGEGRVAPGGGGAPEPRTRVVLLGTGTPNADPDRWGPAVAVVVDTVAYLVDAGPGVVRRAAAAARLHGITALRAPRLRRVFLTHLHSDHTLGLPDLILSPWVLGRDVPLEVYGPEGTRAMVERILEAWAEDIRIRIYGLEPANPEGYRVRTVEVEPGLVYRDERVRVEAFPVRHGSWPRAFGYRFRSGDRTVVISGDAAPGPAVAEACRGCDVLVHEVYSADRFRARSPEWRRYHAAFHTSTEELARLAREARPRLLVLYHELFWGATPEELVEEIRTAGYRGRVVAGADLDVF